MKTPRHAHPQAHTATLTISSLESSFGGTPGGTPDEPFISQPADVATMRPPPAATLADGPADSATHSDNAGMRPALTQPADGMAAIPPLSAVFPTSDLSLVPAPFELPASVLDGTNNGDGSGAAMAEAPLSRGEHNLDVAHAAASSDEREELRSPTANLEREDDDEHEWGDGVEQPSNPMCSAGVVSDTTTALVACAACRLNTGEPSSKPIKDSPEPLLDAAFTPHDAPVLRLSHTSVLQFGFSPQLTGNKRKARPEEDEPTRAAAWSIRNQSPFALDRKRFMPSPK
jgi:hypothetical protein